MVVHRLGPTGHGFSLLSVRENDALRRMQADGLKIYACNCTSHPINLWRPVSSVVTEKKKDHRVLTVPFSYNRGNMVIIFHQSD